MFTVFSNLIIASFLFIQQQRDYKEFLSHIVQATTYVFLHMRIDIYWPPQGCSLRTALFSFPIAHRRAPWWEFLVFAVVFVVQKQFLPIFNITQSYETNACTWVRRRDLHNCAVHDVQIPRSLSLTVLIWEASCRTSISTLWSTPTRSTTAFQLKENAQTLGNDVCAGWLINWATAYRLAKLAGTAPALPSRNPPISLQWMM